MDLSRPFRKRARVLLALALICLSFFACRKDPPAIPEPPPAPGAPPPGSPVVWIPAELPYPTLSAYGLYQGDLKDLDPVYGVLPYDVITPLFSDHASKKRFIWMPDSVSAVHVGDHQVLDMPENTLLVKNFYYDNVQPGGARRIIETRLMFRRNGLWEFANYVWDDQQTEAYLDMNGSFTPVTFTDQEGITRSIDYRIPAAAECHTCHKSNGTSIPIGPKPQNLDRPFEYASGVQGQLDKWVQVGYLHGDLPASIDAVVRWNDHTQDLHERVRAYLDMNCAHCHSEGGHCDYRPMRFAYHETTNEAALGICVEPHEPLQPHHTHIVAKGNIERSLLHYRLQSTEVSERMPLLGRTVVHEEGLEMIEQWIEAMSPACE